MPNSPPEVKGTGPESAFRPSAMPLPRASFGRPPGRAAFRMPSAFAKWRTALYSGACCKQPPSGNWTTRWYISTRRTLAGLMWRCYIGLPDCAFSRQNPATCMRRIPLSWPRGTSWRPDSKASAVRKSPYW